MVVVSNVCVRNGLAAMIGRDVVICEIPPAILCLPCTSHSTNAFWVSA